MLLNQCGLVQTGFYSTWRTSFCNTCTHSEWTDLSTFIKNTHTHIIIMASGGEPKQWALTENETKVWKLVRTLVIHPATKWTFNECWTCKVISGWPRHTYREDLADVFTLKVKVVGQVKYTPTTPATTSIIPGEGQAYVWLVPTLGSTMRLAVWVRMEATRLLYIY